MPNRADRNFLKISLIVFIGALAIAALLFGTQVIPTQREGGTIQAPQAAKRERGVNPSAQ